ncbi:MAG: hypothetical protein U9O98_11690 [Asgard group archaeon]|nr:hypothetical protein [Asgard group archaeon]
MSIATISKDTLSSKAIYLFIAPEKKMEGEKSCKKEARSNSKSIHDRESLLLLEKLCKATKKAHTN